MNYEGVKPAQDIQYPTSGEPENAEHLVRYRPRRRGVIPSIVKTVATVASTGLIFFLIEAYAPPEFTISKLMGTNDARITAEVKAAELRQQAVYEAWASEAKVSVEQQVDRYRTQNQAILAYYQGSIDLTKMSQEAALRIQGAYVDQQMALTRSQQSTDVMLINWGRLLGRGLNLASPGSGESALTYSDRLGTDLADELMGAARRGQLVSFEGWGAHLPSVAELQAQYDALPPLTLPPTPAMASETGQLGSLRRGQ